MKLVKIQNEVKIISKLKTEDIKRLKAINKNVQYDDKGKPILGVDIGTNGALQLQMLVDVPDSLTRETENIFVRGVAVFIKIPVWVFVILVVTVPVLIVAICIFIVFEPSLIVSACQSHQVLAHVAL